MEWVMVPPRKLSMEGIIWRFCTLSDNTGFGTSVDYWPVA